MSIEIRRLTPDDAPRLLDLDDYAFVNDPTRPDRDRGLEQVDWERAFGATRQGAHVGSYLVHDLRLAAPGPLGGITTHPLDGLSWVAVHPDHRRRGVLAAMMAHHVQQARERGATWSGLHASDPAIYGRYGYAVASLDVRLEFGGGTALTAPPVVEEQAAGVELTTIFDVGHDDVTQRVRTITRACSDTAIGTVTWPDGKLHGALRDEPEARRGTEPLRGVVARRDGTDVGVALYSRTLSWEPDGTTDGQLHVMLIQARDPGVLLALARRLLAEDLMRTITFGDRGFDDPLLWWASGPRAVNVRVVDGLWLRPIDVGAALSARGYAAACDVVLDVADDLGPWNTGAWRLRVGTDGAGRCEPTSRAADVRLRVQALGSAYLGLRGWGALAACGDVQELRPGALAELTAAFATSAAPVGGLMF